MAGFVAVGINIKALAIEPQMLNIILELGRSVNSQAPLGR